jgi:hypothetical protein
VYSLWVILLCLRVVLWLRLAHGRYALLPKGWLILHALLSRAVRGWEVCISLLVWPNCKHVGAVGELCDVQVIHCRVVKSCVCQLRVRSGDLLGGQCPSPRVGCGANFSDLQCCRLARIVAGVISVPDTHARVNNTCVRALGQVAAQLSLTNPLLRLN